MPKIKIPQKLKWLFWSYDINSIDLEADKDYIIQQVLNYGTWDDVKWLLKTYPEVKIKETIKNPSRGVWFDDVLNFWETIYGFRIKKDIRERAIFSLHPHQ
jgi:hypothetical protein